jgi:hypothetical protein
VYFGGAIMSGIALQIALRGLIVEGQLKKSQERTD